MNGERDLKEDLKRKGKKRRDGDDEDEEEGGGIFDTIQEFIGKILGK